MLICYCACSLLYLERLFCLTRDLQHGGVYLLTIDTEFGDVVITTLSRAAVSAVDDSLVVLLV